MNILGIDQSLTNSGYAIYKDSLPLILGNVVPLKKIDKVDRLIFIRDSFKQIILDNAIDLVIIEEYAWAGRGDTFSIGENGGNIRILCKDLKVLLFVMPITTHKMYSTGKGNTKKDMMLKEVYKRFKVDVSDDNVADAVSITMTFLGYCQWKFDKKSKNHDKIQLRAFDTLEKMINSDKNMVDYLIKGAINVRN